MKDVIWTIIIIWAIYKILDIFRGVTVKKTFVYNQYNQNQNRQNQNYQSRPEGSVSIDKKASANKQNPTPKINDGEYVDFEEIK